MAAFGVHLGTCSACLAVYRVSFCAFKLVVNIPVGLYLVLLQLSVFCLPLELSVMAIFNKVLMHMAPPNPGHLLTIPSTFLFRFDRTSE